MYYWTRALIHDQYMLNTCLIHVSRHLDIYLRPVPKAMMQKALWYVEHQATHVHVKKLDDGAFIYYFLRKDHDAADAISKTLVQAYEDTMCGKWPKRAACLDGLLDLTQCLHRVEESDDKWGCVECEMNPLKLVCSCKSCKGYGICSHILAVNHILREYNVRYELHQIGKRAAKYSGGNG